MNKKAIGVIMLNTSFPRIKGDIGNKDTFDFPVIYETIDSATQKRVVKEADTSLIPAFIKAGLKLINEGACAIVTSCGFTAIYQEELAASLPVPVFATSLLQLPLVYSMLKPSQEVGIITADSNSLTSDHFKGVNSINIPKCIVGIQDTHLGDVFLRNYQDININKGTEEILNTVDSFIEDNPDIGALLLECTNLPPFADAIRERTGLPVFDIVTLTKYVYSSISNNFYLTKN